MLEDPQILLQPVPTKKPTINVVVSEELKRAIEKWAEEEGRTQSNLCERILGKAAKDSGYLAPDSPEKTL